MIRRRFAPGSSPCLPDHNIEAMPCQKRGWWVVMFSLLTCEHESRDLGNTQVRNRQSRFQRGLCPSTRAEGEKKTSVAAHCADQFRSTRSDQSQGSQGWFVS